MLKTKKGKLIVIAGLPATGKSTLVKQLIKVQKWASVPERENWFKLIKNIQNIPANLEEKKEKQRCFLEIDCERYRIAQDLLNTAEIVLCIQDFTASLAYNYAERWFIPEIDCYEWLIETNLMFLQQGKIGIPDTYIYLDATLNQRKKRRDSDDSKSRNNIFFQEIFTNNMQRFYYELMHPCAPRKVLQTFWYNYEKSCLEELATIQSIILSLADSLNEFNFNDFKLSLYDTIIDKNIILNECIKNLSIASLNEL